MKGDEVDIKVMTNTFNTTVTETADWKLLRDVQCTVQTSWTVQTSADSPVLYEVVEDAVKSATISGRHGLCMDSLLSHIYNCTKTRTVSLISYSSKVILQML